VENWTSDMDAIFIFVRTGIPANIFDMNSSTVWLIFCGYYSIYYREVQESEAGFRQTTVARLLQTSSQLSSMSGRSQVSFLTPAETFKPFISALS
jgi:hypothetical protein